MPSLFFILPEASFGLCVLSLPASVCVSLRPSVCQSLSCPRDNSGPVQARITKFGSKMQKTLVKVPFVLVGNWPWPSRSNLTWKSEFTPFWACPHHNSNSVSTRCPYTDLGSRGYFGVYRRSCLLLLFFTWDLLAYGYFHRTGLCVCVCLSVSTFACLRNNWSPVQTRIT